MDCRFSFAFCVNWFWYRYLSRNVGEIEMNNAEKIKAFAQGLKNASPARLVFDADKLCDMVIEMAEALEQANQIILLTHPQLSDGEMNTLTTRQYILWKEYHELLTKLAEGLK